MARYFSETKERGEQIVFRIYIFISWRNYYRTEGKTKVRSGEFFEKISNGRKGEIRLLSVDYFCTSGRAIFARNGRASPRIAHCTPWGSRAWNGERNPWKRGRILKNTEGAQRGRPVFQSVAPSINYQTEYPTIVFWGIRRPVLAVEKLSPSCYTGGRPWINRAWY